MPRTSQLALAKPRIIDLLGPSDGRILTERQLARLLGENRQAWQLAENTKLPQFIAFLTKHGELRRHTFRSDRYGKKIIRYSWGATSPLQLAASIKLRGYFSHATAAALHGLLKPKDKMIYLNVEQSEKPPNDGILTQAAIDRAFANKQRQSNLIYTSEDVSVTILAGKYTNRLAIEEIKDLGMRVEATSLERTLIDIVVRPLYAGGISNIVTAYRAAKDRIDIETLLGVLRKLDHAYPYHQAIGFLMEMSGHPEKQYARLRALGLEHDFYLGHGMQQQEYSKEWRLYYPHAVRRTSEN